MGLRTAATAALRAASRAASAAGGAWNPPAAPPRAGCDSPPLGTLGPAGALGARRMFLSAPEAELRRRRLLLRAKSTGMKELDLILGAFIRANPRVLQERLEQLESLLELETCLIYDSLMGKVRSRHPMVREIRAFMQRGAPGGP